ncbi:hypothetical protein BDN70DRAFT_346809 [Pholiota conissans]|uniref:Uncharacterized protein n=1 Tax=Pholiota conissans TaxID=109636 RepID=A0A9P5YQE0_9AGAR|nr:hypothetical protein BDN70DRAFT_346809 [Pholiota conissans]
MNLSSQCTCPMSRLERQDGPSRSCQVRTSSSYYPTVICYILTWSRCSPPTQKLSFNSSPTSKLTSPHPCLGHDARLHTSACAPASLLPPLFQFPLRAHPHHFYPLSPILRPHIRRVPGHFFQHSSIYLPPKMPGSGLIVVNVGQALSASSSDLFCTTF